MSGADVKAVPFWAPAEIEAALLGTVVHLQRRRVLAYPTETVYGFGGGIDQESVDALVSLKGRAKGKPFLMLIASSPMLERLDLHLPPSASNLAAHFWPGPLTLVLPGGEKRVPDALRNDDGGIAVRWTPHPAIARLIQALGDPITSTSANRPGNPPAMSPQTVLADWRDAVASGALRVLDGGTLSPSSPSTVVDCTGARARVVREGAIPASRLREIVPDLLYSA